MSVTLLDGGIGQELVRRAKGAPTPLWSTQVMMDQPEIVTQLHLDFCAAGADVITTNTYSLLPDRLVTAGIAAKFEALLATALDAAQAAWMKYPDTVIAGSLGPLRASYRPDICPPAGQAAREYERSVRMMAERVDLLIIETMTSVEMAEGALMAATGQGVPVWLAMSVDDTDGTILRSGEALARIAPLLERYAPEAVLLNCSRPEAIGQGIGIVSEFGLPFGAYANGFTGINDAFRADAPTVDVLEHRADLGPAEYSDFAMKWVDEGASIVGGCCEVGPAHIAEIRQRLQ